MLRRHRALLLALPFVLLTTASLTAAEPFRYPEGKHGKGELKYVNGIPVLTVQGTPEEVGEQVGVLAIKPVPNFGTEIKAAVKALGLEPLWPLIAAAGRGLYAKFPEDHRKEIDAMAKASGVERDTLIVANTIPDLMKIAACSGLLIEAERSQTKAPLYGRNTDLPPMGNVPDMTLLIVCRLEGKQPFATLTWPGLLVGTTGINAAGLCFGINDVRTSADKARKFDAEGVPTLARLRKLIENSTTVAEAEKQARADKATTMGNLLLCDKNGALVIEMTPKSIVVRKPEEGICSCTNHFRTKELAMDLECGRFTALEKCRTTDKLGVAEVAKLLDTAAQGDATIQTIVYEPEALRAHIAYGKRSSAKPLKTVELGPLFKGEEPKPR